MGMFAILAFFSLWSLDIVTLLYAGDYFVKGTRSEFISFSVDIIMSVVFWILLFSFTFIPGIIKGFKKLLGTYKPKDEKKDELSTVKIVFSLTILLAYLIGLIYNMLPSYSMENNVPEIPLFSSIFSPYYFFWNLVFVLLVCIPKYNSNTIKNILLHINLLTFTIFLFSLSFISTHNKIFNADNSSSYVSKNMLCNKTYFKYKSPLSFEEVPCPGSYLSQDDAYKNFGEHGSTVGYLLSLGKLKTNEEKVHLAKRFYESNKDLETPSWIEENVPSVYKRSSLSFSRKFYLENNIIDKQVITLMESKNYDKVKEIANDLKQKRAETKALYQARTDKLPENAEFIKRVESNSSSLITRLKFD